MAMRLIWIGCSCFDTTGAATARPVLRLYDDAGNNLAAISFGLYAGYPGHIQGDIHGDICVAPIYPNESHTGAEFRKFSRDGYELTTPIHHYGAPISQFLTDAAGNTYVSGVPVKADGTIYSYPTSGAHARGAGYYTLHKFNASGALVWSVDTGQDYYPGYATGGGRFTIDSSGDVVVTYDYGEVEKRLKKLSGTDGSTIWGPVTYTPYNGSFLSYYLRTGQVACDSSGNIYCMGFDVTTTAFASLYKYNSSGVFQSKIALDEIPYDFRVDASNVLHFVSAQGYRKFNSSLTQTFYSASPSYYQSSIIGGAADSDNGIYYGFPAPSGYIDNNGTYPQLRKYDGAEPSATLAWEAENYWPLPKPTGTWAAFVCIDIVEGCEHPALPDVEYIGALTWTGDISIAIPGLADSETLGALTFIRDYIGPPLPAVYRCYLTGGSGTIQLPMSVFQCRRTATGVSITVTCPALTPAQIIAIGERTAGELVVQRGVRFLGGTEQIDELVRAAFSTLRWDGGAGSGSATLSAQVAAPAVNAKTRTMAGISYRNLNNGARRVRCNVDTHLAVGDTANLGGGETLLVDEIVYSITPESALMEISEAST